MTLTMISPKAACFEFAVEHGAPTIARTVAMDIGRLDWAVDALAIGVTVHLCPPL
jgi:hypothetical protein